jgi:hypothetical protein
LRIYNSGMRSSRVAGLLILLQGPATGPASAQLPPPQECREFRRGDTNEDARVNIADAVDTLNFLFIGGIGGITCLDAADSDDSGVVDLTDVVHTLNYLFAGGSAPAMPGPGTCGQDPTPDGLPCSVGSCSRATLPFDFSAFSRFEYSTHQALGFCIEIGDIFEATLEKVQGETYRFQHSVLEEGTSGSPRCIRTSSVPCAVATPRPDRILTSEEAERVRGLFSEVRFHLSPDIACQCAFLDPCIVTLFSWDRASASGFLCDAPHVSLQVGRAIEEMLESLRPAR